MLLALDGADDFGRDARALHQRRAELRVAIAAADGQDALKLDLLAGRYVAVVDVELPGLLRLCTDGCRR